MFQDKGGTTSTQDADTFLRGCIAYNGGTGYASLHYPTSAYGALLAFQPYSNRVVQFYIEGSGSLWTRVMWGGTWGAWKLIGN